MTGSDAGAVVGVVLVAVLRLPQHQQDEAHDGQSQCAHRPPRARTGVEEHQPEEQQRTSDEPDDDAPEVQVLLRRERSRRSWFEVLLVFILGVV